VQETVDTVKESVQDTVQSVKDTFNLERQMRDHPWALFAGATALGFVGGRLLGRMSRATDEERIPPFTGGRYGESFTPTATGPGYGASRSASARPLGNGYGERPTAGSSSTPPPSQPAEEKASWLSGITSHFGDEIAKLKGLAIGAVGGAVRDLLMAAAPPALAPRLREVVEGMTEKLGGQRLEGSILNMDSGTRDEGDAREERYEAKMGRPMGAAQR